MPAGGASTRHSRMSAIAPTTPKRIPRAARLRSRTFASGVWPRSASEAREVFLVEERTDDRHGARQSKEVEEPKDNGDRHSFGLRALPRPCSPLQILGPPRRSRRAGALPRGGVRPSASFRNPKAGGGRRNHISVGSASARSRGAERLVGVLAPLSRPPRREAVATRDCRIRDPQHDPRGPTSCSAAWGLPGGVQASRESYRAGPSKSLGVWRCRAIGAGPWAHEARNGS